MKRAGQEINKQSQTLEMTLCFATLRGIKDESDAVGSLFLFFFFCNFFQRRMYEKRKKRVKYFFEK
jgi:hypothetical protein